jgi:hypothetical protein
MCQLHQSGECGGSVWTEPKTVPRKVLGCQQASSELKIAFWGWEVNIDDISVVMIPMLMQFLFALGIYWNIYCEKSKYSSFYHFPTVRVKSIQRVSRHLLLNNKKGNQKITI